MLTAPAENLTVLAEGVADALPSPLPGGIYPRAWATWAAVTAGSFAVLEVAALLSEPGPKTLSAQLRRQRHISGAAIAIGAAWLVHHVVWCGNDTTP
ncbi:hypothetical protein GCM10022252_75320 [Streptosporangium oxazolinicum]|uniref:Uncharacterized protein n=1 Tax=Streptosporangium oxazolinicum TaxID=909287 RepID=A0ABP8BKM7_9ACTN